ncbi:MAG: ATP-dependent zinc metalloprotease FtsH [Bacteroidales bacterium]|jgi:cell division protease FtsH|nr:ATP-dependent zinc metalloprotease FtsH [Bacteroidales bacterium]
MEQQENQRPQEQGQNGNNNKGKRFKFNINLIYIAILAIIIYLQFTSNGFWQQKSFNTTLYKLEQMLIKNDVSKIIVVNKEFAEIFIKTQSVYSDSAYKQLREEDGFSNKKFYIYKFLSVDNFEKEFKQIQVKAREENPTLTEQNQIELTPETRTSFWDGWGSFIWIGLMIFIFIMIFRSASSAMGGGMGGGGSGGIFSFGKSKAQLYDKDTKVAVTFKDVAGLEEAKIEIMEIVDFLKNPKRYTDLGGKIPKGALLVGPPGTGKTLLAKAVAGEAKVPFFSISGSDFVEMFVGVGASRVRDLFRRAKEKAPCIIFIDEIDAIGRARGKNVFTGGNDERESTLNQLLTEMDGFGTNSGVIMLAATNRADVLDNALLRAGRFDRQIHVELPDLDERKSIFEVHLKPIRKADDIDLDFLSKQTPGFSGADIANVCNEAALIAARNNHKNVGRQDFLDAIDRIVGGLERRSKIITKEEKTVIAYHEAGHAAVSWMLKHANPLVKVTIVPRGKSLGAAWYLPEERQITTIEQMLDEMTATLGGRASEEVVFGLPSTGALNDLERVTKQAYSMVVYYGMNKEIGTLSYYDSTGQQEYMFGKPYSEKTAETIDEQVRKMIDMCYENAKRILRENRQKLDELAGILREKEVIFKDDVEHIFGPRPFSKSEGEIAAEKAKPASNTKQDTEQDTKQQAEQTKQAEQTEQEAEQAEQRDKIDKDAKQ